VARNLAEVELDGFRSGTSAGDGTLHQLPLADARAVRFEVMTPARRASNNGTASGDSGLKAAWLG
jgi:hypothetical protein